MAQQWQVEIIRKNKGKWWGRIKKNGRIIMASETYNSFQNCFKVFNQLVCDLGKSRVKKFLYDDQLTRQKIDLNKSEGK